MTVDAVEPLDPAAKDLFNAINDALRQLYTVTYGSSHELIATAITDWQRAALAAHRSAAHLYSAESAAVERLRMARWDQIVREAPYLQKGRAE